MIEAAIVIRTASGERTVSLAEYLGPSEEEAAHERRACLDQATPARKVEGRGFRQRFTIRGDSLWWFTEIYLHRERAIVDVHRAIAATRALIARERPVHIRVSAGSVVVRHVVPLVAKTCEVAAERNRQCARVEETAPASAAPRDATDAGGLGCHD